MQAIGQLDDDDAHVLRHRDEHFAQVFSLRLLPTHSAGQGETTELGHPVDKHRDLFGKLIAELLVRDAAVLHNVMQQGGLEHRHLQLQAGAAHRRGERVLDVGPAGGSLMLAVGVRGVVVGGFDAGDRITAKVAL